MGAGELGETTNEKRYRKPLLLCGEVGVEERGLGSESIPRGLGHTGLLGDPPGAGAVGRGASSFFSEGGDSETDEGFDSCVGQRRVVLSVANVGKMRPMTPPTNESRTEEQNREKCVMIHSNEASCVFQKHFPTDFWQLVCW